MTQWHESVALALEELILELYPVQSQAVQETLHHIHEHENEGSDTSEDKKAQDQL